MRGCWIALLLTLSALRAADGPLVYLPFDGDAAPALAAGGGPSRLGATAFERGRQGEALRLVSDLGLPRAGNLPLAAGTFAAWVCLDAPGSAAAPRYLFCCYGSDEQPEPWLHNRLHLHASGGRLRFGIYGADARLHELNAPIDSWAAGTWHHVAATWQVGVTARIDLYLDGRPAATLPAPGLRLDPPGTTLWIGRDGDGSPDYLTGLLDEVYLYDRVLAPELIAAAAARPAQQESAAPVTRPTRPASWPVSDCAFRATVTVPAADQPRRGLTVAVPLTFAAAAAALSGQARAVDPASIQVLLDGRPVPHSTAEQRVLFRLPADLPAGQTATASLYFDAVRYDLGVPLQARRLAVPRAPSAVPPALPDYATEQLGAPWNFDDGSVGGIDQWGDKPEYLQQRVVDGVLTMQVRQDPFFLWGTMWGDRPAGRRVIDLDVNRYRLLEMRVRQSFSDAEWTVFGRPAGRDDLQMFDFPVSGTSWQTVRLDLYSAARFRGRLQAFRIDPSNSVAGQVEIDWIRLLALTEATVTAVETCGEPSRPAATLALTAPPRAVAGSAQPVVLTVRDAAGQPVSGQPVRLALQGAGGGRLAGPGYGSGPTERVALTDASGEVRFEYHASTTSGAAGDKLAAYVQLSPLPPQQAVIQLQPGPPAKLVCRPSRPVILAPGATSTPLTVQIADAFGNPVATAGQSITAVPPAGCGVTPTTLRSDATGAAQVTVTLDPAQRWVAWVPFESGALRGTAPAVCYTPARQDDRVQLAGNGQFTAGGRPWLPLGGFYANWVGDVPTTGEAGRRLTSFVDTTDAQKIAWLRYLSQQGCTALRFMLRAHRPGGMEPLDIGGRVNPELYAEALRLMDLARPFGLRFLLVLHEDYTKPMYFNADYREKYCLPRWAGVDLEALPPHQRRFVRDGKLLESIDQKYTDPDAIACQDQYATELIGLLKDNPQVFAYELENEMVAVPVSWINHANAVIRAVDPQTPIVMSHGGGGLHTGDPYFWRTRSSIDAYTYHLYPAGTTHDDADYGLVCDVLCRYGRMAGKCFFGESVGDEFFWLDDEPARRRVARDIIWFGLLHGNPGVMFWNNRGHEVNEFARARQLADAADLASWTPRRAPVAVLVTHPLEDDRWYRSAAGQTAQRQMNRYARWYLQRGQAVDFAWDAAGYRATVGLQQFAPAESTAALAPSAGWEALSLVDATGRRGLTYVRNASGVVKWSTPEASPRTMYLRTVQAAPLRLQAGLGAGSWELQATNLVSGAQRTLTIAGDGRVDLGQSDHDWAIWWRQR
ncbi:MAG: hypothetical protein IT204_18150 [Fimbriimonadaceae bacterium]|nr:hypothetical protein [Fimbriimonadaceae bacterium]